MTVARKIPFGVEVKARPVRARGEAWRAEVRWRDPLTGRRDSLSRSFKTEALAEAWQQRQIAAARSGAEPLDRDATFSEYTSVVEDVVRERYEAKTWDPYGAGLRLRVLPAVGHIPMSQHTPGLWDRLISQWRAPLPAADGMRRAPYSESTIKNTLAVASAIFEQAVRDEVISRNPLRDRAKRRDVRRATSDENQAPVRSKALSDVEVLHQLCSLVLARTGAPGQVWVDVIMAMAMTGARIGEISGMRLGDLDLQEWEWTIRRQTTPSPGGVADKQTKSKRVRVVPLIKSVRPIIQRRIAAVGPDAAPDTRIFVGPRGGRITTAILRDATHWDKIVEELGYPDFKRHDLRHTAATWMADEGVQIEVIQDILGHADLATTRKYVHPDRRTVRQAMTDYDSRFESSRRR